MKLEMMPLSWFDSVIFTLCTSVRVPDWTIDEARGLGMSVSLSPCLLLRRTRWRKYHFDATYPCGLSFRGPSSKSLLALTRIPCLSRLEHVGCKRYWIDDLLVERWYVHLRIFLTFSWGL